MRLTPAEAHRAVLMLVTEGKLRESEVRGAIQRADSWIAEARRRLAQLEGHFPGRVAPQATRKGSNKDGPFPARKTRRMPISPARRKQMAEHGRYLGSIRPLSKADRAKVRAIRKARGVAAAIDAARKLGR